MPAPDIIPLSLNDTFQFACHPAVPCFNHCCRDLHQALTPYDVICLKTHLGMTSGAFLEKYTDIQTGPSTGLPVASLRFSADADRACPFLGPNGCRVYPARPSSCRIYPLARGLFRSRQDGRLREQYALVREAHCRGFEQPTVQTVAQWLEGQHLKPFLALNDAVMDLIALKNKLHPAPLSPRQRNLARLALYDLDALKENALAGELGSVSAAPPPAAAGEAKWLEWSLQWIGGALFNAET